MSRLVQWWLVAAIRLLPRRRRELGEGMLAEAASVPPGRARWAWLAGGMWFVGRAPVAAPGPMMAPGADGALRFAGALNAVFRQTLLIWPV